LQRAWVWLRVRGSGVQVAEVPTIDEARINGNVVISVVDPSAEKPPDSPNSTVSTASKLIKAATADSRYTVQQVMFDDMQSLKCVLSLPLTPSA
jgi:hypothetical protein